MASQEARDAAMAAYEAVSNGEEPPAPPADKPAAKDSGRDDRGRFIQNEPVHPETPAEPEETTKPDKPSKPKPLEQKAKPEGEVENDDEKAEKPKVGDLSKEELRKLNFGFEKLARKQAAFKATVAQVEQEKARFEQERQAIPGRVKEQLIQKLRVDPMATVKMLLEEAGIKPESFYADHFTPHMINGGRESEAERIAKLERQLQDNGKATEERESARIREAQAQQLNQAKAQFTQLVTSDEDAYPYITGLLEPHEIADAALDTVAGLKEELGRTPTDVEIAKHLDKRLEARYRRSEKLKALTLGDSGSKEHAERGNGAVKSASPGKTSTLSNRLAAKPATSNGEYSRESAREAALKLWPSSNN